MGYYVGVNLSFSASNLEKDLRALSEAASKTLVELPDGGKYTRILCEEVVKDPNRYVHGGNKGGMFVWSGVWNYYSYEDEAETLKNFLLNCWEYDLKNMNQHIMYDFDQAMLLVNPEQSEKTYIYQFRLKQNGDGNYLPKVLTDEMVIPLSWNQY